MSMSGNDAEAKDWVHRELLERWFDWERVLDLGDITAAGGQEMWMPLWLRVMGAAGTAAFNLRIVAST
jgi:predicted dinucleotide-binding enzyme